MTRRSTSNWKTTIYASNVLLLLGIAVLLYHLPFGPVRGRENFGEGGPDFIRGNANDDPSVDISDAIFCLRYVFSDGDKPRCLAAADIDDNGQIELTDAIALLGHLFQAGPPPGLRFPTRVWTRHRISAAASPRCRRWDRSEDRTGC